MLKVLNWLRITPDGITTPLDVLPLRKRMCEVFNRDDLLTWWLIDSGLTPAQRSDIQLAFLMVLGHNASPKEVEHYRISHLKPLGLCA